MPNHSKKDNRSSSSSRGNSPASVDNSPKRKRNSDRQSSRSPENKRKRGSVDNPEQSKWDSPEVQSRRKDDRRHEQTDNRRSRNEDRRDHIEKRNHDDGRDRRRMDSRRKHDERKDDRYERRDKSENSKDYERNSYNRNKFRDRRRRSPSFDHKHAKWGKDDNKKEKDEKPKEKEKPNFGLSGKLTEETNTYRGVVIKYSEPPEARKPKRRWRLYPFKGEKALQTLYIHRESAYLIGRERKVVDLPVDHPSCSKQHAVLQYRLVHFEKDDGSVGKRVRPYLIDLDSANGTFINNKKIEPKKYVELLEKDVIKFGFSSREYVLLHENSKDEADDDDVKEEEVVEVKQEND